MAPMIHEIQVKNSNIKRIFETMEYGSITESLSLAQAWLTENKHIKGACPQDPSSFLSNIKINLEWFKTSPLQKCFILERFVQEIEKNASLICQLEVLVRGISANDTKTKSLPLLIDYLQYYSQWHLDKLQNSGLAFGIISDTCFLGLLGSILGPALVAGYNILFHTESKIDIIISYLIQLAEKAGIPKGIITNITGNVDIQTIFNNKQKQLVLFPGNLRSSDFIDFKITLPHKVLGIAKGKTPMLVFNNADLDSASDCAIDAAWGYGSALPWNLSTIFVQEDIFETFTDKLKDRLSKINMGLASDKLADLSYPLENNAFQKLQKTLIFAKTYGIQIFQKNPTSEQFQPTILIGGKVSVNNVILEDDDSMVVSVLSFRTTNEVINLANNTRSGIGASVWTENVGLANEVAVKLNFSNIWINTFGNFSASTPFSSYKDSGIGFIGGQEGLSEYIECTPIKTSVLKLSNYVDVQDDLLHSYYGGSFRKSESGIYESIFEVPVAKDLVNAVAAARKGFEVWRKKTKCHRSRLLRQLALGIYSKISLLSDIAKVPEEKIKIWTELTYKALSQSFETNSVRQNNSMLVQSIVEPQGVIAVDEGTEIDDSFMCIITTLLLGNSVIILNYNKAYARFYVEICKLLAFIQFPAGVFNVILNCDKAIKNSVPVHKELAVYFISPAVLIEQEINNYKQICIPMNKWSQFFYAIKIKNIWCNIGESVV